MYVTAYDQDLDGTYVIVEEAENVNYLNRRLERLTNAWNEQYDMVLVTSQARGRGKKLHVWFEGQKIVSSTGPRGGKRLEE
jgi:hypothetical protein